MTTREHMRQMIAAGSDITILLHYRDTQHHAQHLLWSLPHADALVILMGWECGLGPGLNAAMIERGSDFEIVRCWAGGVATRQMIRRAHNNRRFCLRCCFGRARQPRLFR